MAPFMCVREFGDRAYARFLEATAAPAARTIIAKPAKVAAPVAGTSATLATVIAAV